MFNRCKIADFGGLTRKTHHNNVAADAKRLIVEVQWIKTF
jgi:hypothetical protein